VKDMSDQDAGHWNHDMKFTQTFEIIFSIFLRACFELERFGGSEVHESNPGH
jgi:hypothetical protein